MLAPAVLAPAVLATFAALQPACDEEHLPLTVPEIRRLLAVLIPTRCRTTRQVLHWSQGRRRQYRRRSQPRWRDAIGARSYVA
ncbi:hypothetical protein GCM10022248_39000 [Nonomuraea soli]